MKPTEPQRWRGLTLLTRLTRNIDYRGNGGCWIWRGSANDNGYGRIQRDGRSDYTHRVMFEMYVGPIPNGLHLDHICRNTPCCNPEHLEPVSPRENMARGIAPSAVARRANQCQRGHEFTVENTYQRPRGKRMCATCLNARTAIRVRRLSEQRAVARAAKVAAGIPLRPDLARDERGQFIKSA